MSDEPDLTVAAARGVLQAALSRPLPGARAQELMSPAERPGWRAEQIEDEGRPAAVLALICPAAERDGAELILTERTRLVAAHRGQISFPGGMIEAGETPEQAALRETAEEIGVKVDPAALVGRLTRLGIPATGFCVTPVVALVSERPQMVVNRNEVARIFGVPLVDLLRPGAVQRAARTPDGMWTEVPYFEVSGAWLWGATAMMTAELLVLLGWSGPDA